MKAEKKRFKNKPILFSIPIMFFLTILFATSEGIAEPVNSVDVKAAYNGEYIFFQLEWKDSTQGRNNEYLCYENGKWMENKETSDDKMAIMIGDGKVKCFSGNGCYAVCHRDLRDQPDSPSKSDVYAHPYFGRMGLEKEDMRKYILESRTRSGWANVKSRAEIEKLRSEGIFLDLWKWRAHGSDIVNWLTDGYILEYKYNDKGDSIFSTNYLRDKNRPKYMYQEKITGFRAFPYSTLEKQPYYYLSEDTAVPFNPAEKFKYGDTIPGWIIGLPTESQADLPILKGKWANGRWQVAFKRKLTTDYPQDDIPLAPGEKYYIGIAIHNDAKSRWHNVSLPLVLGLGTRGDIEAVRFSGDSPDWNLMRAATIKLFYPEKSVNYIEKWPHSGSFFYFDIFEKLFGNKCVICHAIEDGVLEPRLSLRSWPLLGIPAAIIFLLMVLKIFLCKAFKKRKPAS